MANVSQNIDSSKSFDPQTERKSLERQKKLIKGALTAFWKAQDREESKRKKKAPTVQAETVADIPKKKKSEKWQVPIEVLKSLFYANRMAALPLYLFATRHANFGGMLPERKIHEISKLIERSPASTKRKLAQLQALGLCRQNGKTWMFVGCDIFTAYTGRTTVKSVKIQSLKRSDLTTLAYSAIISEQGRRIAYKEKKTQPSIVLDRLQKVPISCSFTSAYSGKSISAISRQRKQARRLGLLAYERNFEAVLRGGGEVSEGFSHALHRGDTKRNDLLFKNRDGSFIWAKEKPALFSGLQSFSIHRVSPSLCLIAKQSWETGQRQ